MSSPDRVTLAMTGASGAQYGLRLLDCLVREEREVHFLISKAAQLVLATETDVTLPPKPQAMQQFLSEYTGASAGQIRVYDKEDWMAPAASGSGAPTAMVVVPCSTGTLSAIATGACNNLIERAADVIDRAELSEPGKPLAKERWAGVVDSVGSHTLANACAATKANGAVAACGCGGDTGYADSHHYL